MKNVSREHYWYKLIEGAIPSREVFQCLTPRQGLEELRSFLDNVNISSNRTIFRSDHASNYLILKGRLGRDKQLLLDQLDDVLMAPPEQDVYNLRPEWSRGL